MTDVFATCADLLSAPLPTKGAEDSASFLSVLLGDIRKPLRSTLVSHSNHGEFAFRDGPWKLVFKNAHPNRNLSRGKPTIAELYNLKFDIAEKQNLAGKRPNILRKMTKDFERLIRNGTSRKGQKARNDTRVRFDITQTERWGPAARRDK